jgi:hypothetical protein
VDQTEDELKKGCLGEGKHKRGQKAESRERKDEKENEAERGKR